MRISGLAAFVQRQLAPVSPAVPPMALDTRHEPRTAAATTAAVPQSVQMLVALAAEQTEPERRCRMVAEAEMGLEGLEALHREVLAGGVSSERLNALAKWSRGRSRSGDPHLATLMDEIDLRVQVELAKRER